MSKGLYALMCFAILVSGGVGGFVSSSLSRAMDRAKAAEAVAAEHSETIARLEVEAAKREAEIETLLSHSATARAEVAECAAQVRAMREGWSECTGGAK